MTQFAFFGTSSFAATVLDELATAGFLPSLIVTVPDAPVGRKRLLTPPPVKRWAQEHHIPVAQPSLLKGFNPTTYYLLLIESDDSSESERPTTSFDLFIVVDYGKLIPKELLTIPKHGSLNVHVSLLPKFRGPSPMQTALFDGEDKTGVTIMEVVEGLDEGNIVAQEIFDLTSWQPTHTELRERSAKAGGKLLARILPNWIAGKIKSRPQDHTQATYTKKFTSEDAYIEPDIVLGKKMGEEAKKAERMVRALNPDPGTWTLLPPLPRGGVGWGTKGELEIRLKILSAHLDHEKFVPDLVLPAGKKEMNWQNFLRGNHIS